MARAINNFKSGKVDDRGNLELKGETTEDPGSLTFDPLDPKTTLPTGSKIHVVLISENRPFKRCEADSPNPESSTWGATVSADDNPFGAGDEVYAIGRAQIDGEQDFVWANALTIV